MQQRLLSRWSQATPRAPMSSELWVIGCLDTLEKMQFSEADLINGKVSELLGSAYILIKGERLPPAP